MPHLALLKSLLGLVQSYMGWMGDKQLLDAGEARAMEPYLRKANELMSKGIEARSRARAESLNPGPAGLRNDGYRRD